MENWNSVFEAHPDVDKIFVVDGMPFLEELHAQGHANTTGKNIETVTRKAKAKPAEKSEGDNASAKKEKAEKKPADKPAEKEAEKEE